jgi:hypothetical protein
VHQKEKRPFKVFFYYLKKRIVRILLVEMSAMNIQQHTDKGKPAEKRGRKATGLKSFDYGRRAAESCFCIFGSASVRMQSLYHVLRKKKEE